MAPSHLVHAMPQFRHHRAFVPSRSACSALRLTISPAALLAPLALFAFVASTASAQGSAASGPPLHLAADRFEFLASGDAAPAAKPLRVHNGGKAQFTDVRLTRLTYTASARGAAWLVSVPRQSAVAPDELATVGSLCVDATGLKAGTYHAKAAVSAREVPEGVPFTITLVVTEAGARARPAAARCGSATK